jgi:hypothetical protein
LQFVDGLLETLAIAERLYELHDAAHRIEGCDLQHISIVEIEDALIGVFGEQSIKHGAGLWAIFCEYVALLDLLGPLTAGQRLFVEGDVTDEVKRVEVLADFVGDRIER